MNSALHNEPDEDQQAIFLQWVDRFTPWHLRILSFFDGPRNWFQREGRAASQHMLGGPAQVLEEAFPELRDKREFYDQIDSDLGGAGLMHSGGLHVTMTGDGMMSSRTTPIGRRFLAFITEPGVAWFTFGGPEPKQPPYPAYRTGWSYWTDAGDFDVTSSFTRWGNSSKV